MADIRDAYREALNRYGRRSSVTGIDIGFRYTDGVAAPDVVLRIHVREKIAREDIVRRSLIPDTIRSTATDILEAVYSADDGNPHRTKRRDTLIPGISVGARGGLGPGTLGMIAFDRDSGAAGILSNWHVLAGPGARDAQKVVQPAPADQGRAPQDVVAILDRKLLNRNGDAAFALLNGSRPFQRRAMTSGVVVDGARPPALGDTLEKSGRSTAVTRGQVDGIGRYFVRYGGRRRGIDGFRLVPTDDGNPGEMSAGGDSGSLWYDPATREGVGLHFAGETRRGVEFALACNLVLVLDRLSLKTNP